MAGGSLLTPLRVVAGSPAQGSLRDPALAAAILFEENNGDLLSCRPFSHSCFCDTYGIRKSHPVAVAPTSIGGQGIESNRIGQTSGTNTVDLIVV
jgi:hypothetical protein